MIFEECLTKMWNNPIETVKLIVEIAIIIVLLCFKYKTKTDVIDLPEETVDKLILDFLPEDLVEDTPPSILLDWDYDVDYLDLSNYDVFNLRNRFKEELKDTVRTYGIGTCGPPSFYGTLDLHIQLEEAVAQVLGKEKAVLYSNYYSCISSVIPCFCMAGNYVFYQKTASEGIIRGLYLSKAKTFEFTTFSSLEGLLEIFIKSNTRNYVIVEGLSKNTGTIFPLHRLLQLKTKYKYRILLDEAYSIPLLHKQGTSGYLDIDLKHIDMIVGAFSYGFPSNGGFFAGTQAVCEYQRLSSSSYTFSASLPAIFAKFNILALKEDLDCGRLRHLSEVFHSSFVSEYFTIVSCKPSPIIIITIDETPDRSSITEISLLKCIHIIKHHLHSKKIYLGINKNPLPSLRVIVKTSLDENETANMARMISTVCDDAYLNILK